MTTISSCFAGCFTTLSMPQIAEYRMVTMRNECRMKWNQAVVTYLKKLVGWD
jgi:hypothetical protein